MCLLLGTGDGNDHLGAGIGISPDAHAAITL